jgi:predicted RNA-binding Zn-ribbon protein involved in translation (DUF1610 family)
MYTQFTSNINTTPYINMNTATNNINNNSYNTDDMPSIGSSPTISTPFLDSSSTIDTPYNVSSPFFDTAADFSPYLMYASFGTPFNNNNISMNNNGVRNLNDNKDDVCIARYLDGHESNDLTKLAAHDPLKFNGDPSLLLLDKSKTNNYTPVRNNHHTARKPSPTIKLETVTEEDSDSLFPPLNSSQQSAAYSPIMKNDHYEDMSFDDILGFDAGSPLSESNGEDSDNLYEEEAQQSQSQQQQPAQHQHQVKEEAKEEASTSTEQTASRKRKASSSSSATTSATATAAKKRRSSANIIPSAAKKSSAATEETKMYQCPLCDHVSKRKYNLSTHIKTHDKARVKEFDCPNCPKSFDRRHDRDRHLATVHRGERSYSCDHCTTHFSRRDALNRHLVQKHDYDEEDFQ